MELNLTIKNIFGSDWKLSNECIGWCKEQHFIHENNLTIEGMLIPLLALILLFIHYIIINHHVFIEKITDIKEDTLQKICLGSSELAIYLLIGFFIWFIYFK